VQHRAWRGLYQERSCPLRDCCSFPGCCLFDPTAVRCGRGRLPSCDLRLSLQTAYPTDLISRSPRSAHPPWASWNPAIPCPRPADSADYPGRVLVDHRLCLAAWIASLARLRVCFVRSGRWLGSRLLFSARLQKDRRTFRGRWASAPGAWTDRALPGSHSYEAAHPAASACRRTCPLPEHCCFGLAALAWSRVVANRFVVWTPLPTASRCCLSSW